MLGFISSFHTCHVASRFISNAVTVYLGWCKHKGALCSCRLAVPVPTLLVLLLIGLESTPPPSLSHCSHYLCAIRLYFVCVVLSTSCCQISPYMYGEILHLPAWHSRLLFLCNTTSHDCLGHGHARPGCICFLKGVSVLYVERILFNHQVNERASKSVCLHAYHTFSNWLVCIFFSLPFHRRSWRTSRRRRACPRRRRSRSCLVSWPWWTFWCSPAPSTSARSRRRRTCPREGWWGNASDWVCVSLIYSIFIKDLKLLWPWR